MKIAILGAGHGGVAMSSDLRLQGYDVNLYAVENHSLNLKLIDAAGSIHVEGVTTNHKCPIDVKADFIVHNVRDAIKDAQIIFVNVPAFAQEVYNEDIMRYGEKGQIVVYPCGGFSAINFYNELKEFGRAEDFIVCETASFIYTTKITGPAKVLIKSIKEKVQFAAFPEERTDEALSVLNTLYPQFYKAQNAWQTSFNNPSSVLHTITTLMNMSRIEQMGSYKNSYYDITPGVARIIEAVDAERVEIAKHFFSNTMPMKNIMQSLYNIEGNDFYETIMNIKPYKTQRAPENMQHRYVSEDIPYSLVPIATLGASLNIPTPNMDSIINIACMCNAEDYWTTGRNAQKLGFNSENIHLVENNVAKI